MAGSIYTVAQINSYIKNMFTQDYLLGAVSVKGEVSNCKYHASGHIYFTLKDKQSAISCVMFAGSRKGLSFSLKEGMQVVVSGRVDTYERDGKQYDTVIKPIYDESAGRYYMGLYGVGSYQKFGIFGTVKYSLYEVGYWINTTVKSLELLIQGQVSKDDVSGPVGMAQTVTDLRPVKTGRHLLYLAEYAQFCNPAEC